jgi:conjugal transfer/entry exclusion protein
MKKVIVYFRSKAELELYKEVKSFAEQMGVRSLSQAVIRLFLAKEQTIQDLRRSVAATQVQLIQAQEMLEMYKTFFEITDPESREITAKALNHLNKLRDAIEKASGLKEKKDK